MTDNPISNHSIREMRIALDVMARPTALPLEITATHEPRVQETAAVMVEMVPEASSAELHQK